MDPSYIFFHRRIMFSIDGNKCKITKSSFSLTFIMKTSRDDLDRFVDFYTTPKSKEELHSLPLPGLQLGYYTFLRYEGFGEYKVVIRKSDYERGVFLTSEQTYELLALIRPHLN